MRWLGWTVTMVGLGGCGDAVCPDADEDEVCDAEDVCAGEDDGADRDGDGTPDGCEAEALFTWDAPRMRTEVEADAIVVRLVFDGTLADTEWVTTDDGLKLTVDEPSDARTTAELGGWWRVQQRLDDDEFDKVFVLAAVADDPSERTLVEDAFEDEVGFDALRGARVNRIEVASRGQVWEGDSWASPFELAWVFRGAPPP